jgi:two-component system, LytTR family, response regulator LytT
MRVLIVEDEASIAERIQRMVMQITGEPKQFIRIASTFDQAILYFTENVIDLLLLDLNLNGRNGFQLLQQAVAGSFHTIIISAHQDKAIEAFEFGVLDFVSKPFTYERLKKAFERLKQKSATGSTTKCLAIRKSGNIVLVNTDDVKYIKANGDYSYLYLNDNSKLLHDKSLENLEIILQPIFFRIHKSYIIKLCDIKKIHVSIGSKYEVELMNGEVLPVGRTRDKELKGMFLG